MPQKGIKQGTCHLLLLLLLLLLRSAGREGTVVTDYRHRSPKRLRYTGKHKETRELIVKLAV